MELNADLGEGFPHDGTLMTLVTQANVACGFHAGDETTMLATCRSAVQHGVTVGAQVSYRDRAHFGRRDLDVDHDTLVRDLAEQVTALIAIAAQVGANVSYLKPHGALYNRAARDQQQARAVVEVCERYGLPVMCLPGSAPLLLAAAAGLDGWREFFADRAYDREGSLVPRTVDGAVVSDPAVVEARVDQLLEQGTVTAVDGTLVEVAADSICVHGDSRDAVALARAVRAALERSA
jgi:UPF0271 protein